MPHFLAQNPPFVQENGLLCAQTTENLRRFFSLARTAILYDYLSPVLLLNAATIIQLCRGEVACQGYGEIHTFFHFLFVE